jgi:hypothetical protein
MSEWVKHQIEDFSNRGKDIGKHSFNTTRVRTIVKNFFAHFKYSYQNPLWYFLESILPKKLRSTIFIVGVKPYLN